MNEKRLGVIAVIIENAKEAQGRINAVISEFSQLVVGRMGIPYRDRNLSVISLIVDGNENAINTLTGRLGSINGVTAKAVMTKRFD